MKIPLQSHSPPKPFDYKWILRSQTKLKVTTNAIKFWATSNNHHWQSTKLHCWCNCVSYICIVWNNRWFWFKGALLELSYKRMRAVNKIIKYVVIMSNLKTHIDKIVRVCSNVITTIAFKLGNHFKGSRLKLPRHWFRTCWELLLFILESEGTLSRDADKFLAFLICSTTKRIFLGWVKEVGTTKS
jgi:hypothetical protein